MRQLFYASRSSAPPGKADLDGILDTSRHNNAIDGITGLLWSDRTRFIQVLEGPRDSVANTFARISADPRHDAVTILSDEPITERAFGSWSMAYRDMLSADDPYDAHLQRLLIDAPDTIREQFRDFVTAP